MLWCSSWASYWSLTKYRHSPRDLDLIGPKPHTVTRIQKGSLVDPSVQPKLRAAASNLLTHLHRGHVLVSYLIAQEAWCALPPSPDLSSAYCNRIPGLSSQNFTSFESAIYKKKIVLGGVGIQIVCHILPKTQYFSTCHNFHPYSQLCS